MDFLFKFKVNSCEKNTELHISVINEVSKSNICK